MVGLSFSLFLSLSLSLSCELSLANSLSPSVFSRKKSLWRGVLSSSSSALERLDMICISARNFVLFFRLRSSLVSLFDSTRAKERRRESERDAKDPPFWMMRGRESTFARKEKSGYCERVRRGRKKKFWKRKERRGCYILVLYIFFAKKKVYMFDRARIDAKNTRTLFETHTTHILLSLQEYENKAVASFSFSRSRLFAPHTSQKYTRFQQKKSKKEEKKKTGRVFGGVGKFNPPGG